MSFDFTPESDRQRIQLIAYQRPELLRHPITREKLYNRHVLSRKARADEIGVNTVMYRDFYMAGKLTIGHNHNSHISHSSHIGHNNHIGHNSHINHNT